MFWTIYSKVSKRTFYVKLYEAFHKVSVSLTGVKVKHTSNCDGYQTYFVLTHGAKRIKMLLFLMSCDFLECEPRI